jgi:hypothetical protein
VPEFGKNNNLKRMKKVILTYGLIAGTIVAAMMFITVPLHKNGTINFDNGEYVGYTTMVVALSMVFFGIKSYRDNYSAGVVTFWQGAKVGLLITAIASVMYALSWEINYHTMDGDYMKEWMQAYFAKLEQQGMSQAEIQEKREYWESFGELYKNFFVRFGVTLMEIAPVGVLITLICAGLFRIKGFLPPAKKITNVTN